MTKSLSRLDYFLRHNRQSLCAYCKAPIQGLFVAVGGSVYGACSMEHSDKILKGERLPRVAYANEEGVKYAVKQSKDTYVTLSKDNDSFVLHEWTQKDREKLFAEVILNFLDYANDQAKTGNLDKITKIINERSD